MIIPDKYFYIRLGAAFIITFIQIITIAYNMWKMKIFSKIEKTILPILTFLFFIILVYNIEKSNVFLSIIISAAGSIILSMSLLIVFKKFYEAIKILYNLKNKGKK